MAVSQAMVGRGAWMLVAVVVLAGCTASSGGKSASSSVRLGDGSQVELKEVKADTPTKGAISGVVVDEAIRPVAAINVTLSGNGKNTVGTDAQGLFTFEGLDPGLYTVSANGTGYLAAQTTAEVIAGEVAKIRMVLPTDTTPKPYHTVMKFDGFIQAGIGAFDQAYQLFVKDVTGIDFCQCQFYYTTDSQPATQVMEVTWERSVDNPAMPSDGYWAIWDDNSSDYYDDDCGNPCLGRVDGGWQKDARNFHTDTWLDYYTPQYQQKFTEFVTVFYLKAAPDGWSFVAGDT